MNRLRRARVPCYIEFVKHIVAALVIIAVCVRAAAADVSFTKEIAPVLVAKCLSCHSAEKAKGAYRLHTFEALVRAGSSEEAPVVPGQPDDSLLFKLLTTSDEDDRMPLKDDALPPAQIAAIRRWIEQGAKFDGKDRALALSMLAPPEHPAAPREYNVPVPITALAFNVAGDQLAASGYHEITIWNPASGELVRRIGNVAERTFDLAFSANGQWLAAASGTPGKIGEVKLFNATNGELARVLVTTTDAALCLAFSPDAKHLAAGGADNTIRIWEMAGGKLLHTIEQHADWVLAVAFSPDGKELASGSRDKSARVFDVKSSELETTFSGHGEFVTAIAWVDNKSVLSASRERKAMRWNARDAKKTADLSGWETPPTRFLLASNRLFSAAMDGKVREHDVEAKKLVRTFEGPRDAAHALARHGDSRLAAGTHDGRVFVWNAQDGALLHQFVAAPGHSAKLSRSP